MNDDKHLFYTYFYVKLEEDMQNKAFNSGNGKWH